MIVNNYYYFIDILGGVLEKKFDINSMHCHIVRLKNAKDYGFEFMKCIICTEETIPKVAIVSLGYNEERDHNVIQTWVHALRLYVENVLKISYSQEIRLSRNSKIEKETINTDLKDENRFIEYLNSKHVNVVRSINLNSFDGEKFHKNFEWFNLRQRELYLHNKAMNVNDDIFSRYINLYKILELNFCTTEDPIKAKKELTDHKTKNVDILKRIANEVIEKNNLRIDYNSLVDKIIELRDKSSHMKRHYGFIEYSYDNVKEVESFFPIMTDIIVKIIRLHRVKSEG